MSGSSKPIEGNEIIRDGALDNIQRDAEKLLSTISQIRDGQRQLGAGVRTGITQNKLNSSADIKKQQQDIAKLNEISEKSNKLRLEEIRINKAREKAFDDYEKKLAASQKQREKEFEIQKKNNSVYQQSVVRLNELKRELKELEIRGQTSGKLYKALGQEFFVLNGKVRDAEEGVGEFYRTIGDYKSVREYQKALIDLQNKGLGPGTKEFDDLAKAAGEFKDKINDAKDATKAFATESKGTQLKNIFGQIGNDLADLDFKGAAEKAKTFAEVAKSITFAEMIAGAKNLATALYEMAAAMLANPVFIIGATIAAVTAAMYAYTTSLEDNSEAIKDNNEFLAESKKKYNDLIESIQEHRRQILLTRGVITQSQFDIQVAQDAARKKDQEETERLNEYKKKLLKDYGLENESALDKILIASGFGINTLAEKWKNYNEKIKQEEAASLAVRLKIREELEASIGDIRAKEVAEEKKKNDEIEKARQDKAAEELKHRQDEWNEILKENREFNEKMRLESNERIKKDAEDTKKKNEEYFKDESDKIRKRTEANTAELERQNEERSKKQKEQLEAYRKAEADYDKEQKEKREKIKQERVEFENMLFDAAQKRIQRINEEEQKGYDKQISQRQQNIQDQQRLAEQGKENSLAFERSQLAKEELEKEAAKKKEVNREKAVAFARLVAGYAEKEPESALRKALLDVAGMAIAEGSFIEGTEKVEDDLKGFKRHNGVDGYRINVDGRERIFNPEQNQMIGDISNDEAARVLNLYGKGALLPIHMMNQSSNITTGHNIYDSLQLQELYNMTKEFKSFKEALKTIPRDKINWNRNGEMIKETVEEGMTTVIKYVKQRPRI